MRIQNFVFSVGVLPSKKLLIIIFTAALHLSGRADPVVVAVKNNSNGCKDLIGYNNTPKTIKIIVNYIYDGIRIGGLQGAETRRKDSFVWSTFLIVTPSGQNEVWAESGGISCVEPYNFRVVNYTWSVVYDDPLPVQNNVNGGNLLLDAARLMDEENRRAAKRREDEKARKAAAEKALKDAEAERQRQAELAARNRQMMEDKRKDDAFRRMVNAVDEERRQESERQKVEAEMIQAKRESERRMQEEIQRQQLINAERMRQAAFEAEQRRVAMERQKQAEIAARKRAESEAINNMLADMNHKVMIEQTAQAREVGRKKRAVLDEENAFLEQYINEVKK